MQIDMIPAGHNVPDEVNVVIEIPQGSSTKYELDKQSGALFVDRFLFTPMFYPGHYGFIPSTLADDGDPVDVIIIAPTVTIIAGAVVGARPIGVLMMSDESGFDEKIIAVPINKLTSFGANINSCADLPPGICDQITHFFTHYKDLEPGKWVKVDEWLGADKAKEIIMQGIRAAAQIR